MKVNLSDVELNKWIQKHVMAWDNYQPKDVFTNKKSYNYSNSAMEEQIQIHFPETVWREYYGFLYGMGNHGSSKFDMFTHLIRATGRMRSEAAYLALRDKVDME